MATSLTYASARDTAQGESKCRESSRRLEMLMVECLQSMYSDLKQDRFYCIDGSFETEPGKASYSWDALGLLSLKEVTLDCEALKQCRADECDEAGGQPTGYEIFGDQIILTPTPDDIYDINFRAVRELNCELYKIIDNGDGTTTKVWNTLDLPEWAHNVYQKCLTGEMFMLAGQERMGANLLDRAANELMAFRTDNSDPGNANAGSFSLRKKVRGNGLKGYRKAGTCRDCCGDCK